MSSNIHLEVASNQLRQDLSQIVDNFTLLDILSKEEKDLVLETKIDTIRKKNEERMRRHQEIEEDKRLASWDVSTISQSSPSSRTPPEKTVNSPVQQLSSPSSDSEIASPASSIEKCREDSGAHGEWWKADRDRGPPSSGAKPKHKEPSSVKSHTETLEIKLHTEGTGLGFGVMNFPGIGVTVKTILPDGVAGKDSRLHSGDLLLEINDVDVADKSLDEVYSILKQCQGDVRLVVSREIMEVSKGVFSQRREGPRRVATKDQTSRPKKEDLVVTFQNDWMDRNEKVKRKVVMLGKNKEDLTISIDTDQNRPLGRGSRGGARGRGRTVRINREEAKQKEFEDKRKENLDRVEAEIAAMREALENEQKASGAVNPPSKSVYSFLDDPARYGANPQQERPPRRNRQEGGKRNQSGRGGGSAVGRGGQRREQRGRGGTNQGQRGNPADTKTTVRMTEKERQEYEKWKRERDKIDQERIRRHQEAAAARQTTNWSSGNREQKEYRDAEIQHEENWDDQADQEPKGQTEMRIGHWDSSDAATEFKNKRSTRSHFEHDDRVGDQQRSQPNNRIGSGRFTQDGNQHGRGGGRGIYYRGGHGQDQGRRGRGVYNPGSRPGRKPAGLTDRELSQIDIRTVSGEGYDPRVASSEEVQGSGTFKEVTIDQWQPTKKLDGEEELSLQPVNTDASIEKEKLTEAAKSLHIEPTASPAQHEGDTCKSPLSPTSPFTPTGHTFLADWAAETEAYSNQQGLVYTNSNVEQAS